MNWMRLTVQSTERASAFASIVLPTPGTSSMSRCPSASSTVRAAVIASRLPAMTVSTFCTMVAAREPTSSMPITRPGAGIARAAQGDRRLAHVRHRRLEVVGDHERHVGGDVAAERRDLPHERARHVRVRRVGQQEHRLDARQVPVHDRHRRLVGDVELRADALDEHGGPDIRAVVDQQPHAPRRHDDAALDAGVGDRPLDERRRAARWAGGRTCRGCAPPRHAARRRAPRPVR